MPSHNQNPLRRIAEEQVEDSFGQLDEQVRLDLVTSIVRQWITYRGNAVIHTHEHLVHYRLLDDNPWQFEVVREIEEGTVCEHLRHARVNESDIPDLLYRLNLGQFTRCYSRSGQLIRIRVDPTNRSTHIEIERHAAA